MTVESRDISNLADETSDVRPGALIAGISLFVVPIMLILAQELGYDMEKPLLSQLPSIPPITKSK